MKFTVKNNSKNITIDVKETNILTRGTGLTFRTKNTQSLLFEFSKDTCVSITGLFVFFPFLIVWLDETNTVLGSQIVKPFHVSLKPSFAFRKFIEVPVNEKNQDIIDFFVGNRRKV